MRLLIDSHAVVWWLLYPGRFREATRELMRSPANQLFLSAASVWELDLKIAKNKLSLPPDYSARLLEDGFDELPIAIVHARAATTLPPIHGDPFDRMLIAQAQCEGLMLVTNDRMIVQYDVPIVDA